MKVNIQDIIFSEVNMYRINDKTTSVKLAQRYLSKIYKDDLIISENGIFDDNTLLALNTFQSEMKIPKTKYIGYETFILLYERYLLALNEEIIGWNAKLKKELPAVLGDFSDTIYNANRMMRDVLNYYGDFDTPPVNNYFSEDTLRSVIKIRKIFELTDKEIIDTDFYSRLNKEWKSIIRIINGIDDYF